MYLMALPRSVEEKDDLRQVELVPTTEGVLVKAKRKPKPRYSLSELLAGITPDNAHPATNWGPRMGKEILASPIISSH